MLDYTKMLHIDPFSLSKTEKEKWFLKSQKVLSKYHYEKCDEYRNIIDKLYIKLKNISHLNEIPYIPARLFKKFWQIDEKFK